MKPLRVGMIGAGGIARPHLAAWAVLGAEVTVYALQGSAELVAQVGHGRVARTLDILLRSVDVVDIVTPTYTHRELAELAIKAGKHVVCEKPLTLSVEDSVFLIDLAQAHGVQLYPAHVVRFFPAYAALRQAVVEGQIGDVAVARFLRTGSYPLWSEWFQDPQKSGGVMMDLMIHDLDLARWVMGEVTEVFATTVESRSDGGLPISIGHVTLTHESGALSYVRGTWGPPGLTFTSSFHVAGESGVLTFDSGVNRALICDGPADAATPTVGLAEGPYLRELRAFTAAIQSDITPPVTAHDGVAAVQIALAAIESAQSGRTVSLSALPNQRIAK